MTGKSIVAVDRSRSSGLNLRDALARTGDAAHVFRNYRAALTFAEQNPVDAVVVEFGTDKETLWFCQEVASLGIQVVFCSAAVEPSDLRQYGFMS